MTTNEKAEIIELRRQGLGYTEIGRMLGISVNTIKTFCRRDRMSGKTRDSTLPYYGACPICGKYIAQNPGRKKKKFCSDKCRSLWWNAHPDKVNRKATYHFVCLHCKKEFTAYGDSGRKYCCHRCYIEDRFGSR